MQQRTFTALARPTRAWGAVGKTGRRANKLGSIRHDERVRVQHELLRRCAGAVGGSSPASLSKRVPTARASRAVEPAPTSAASRSTAPETKAATAPPTPNQSAASRASGFMRVRVLTARWCLRCGGECVGWRQLLGCVFNKGPV